MKQYVLGAAAGCAALAAAVLLESRRERRTLTTAAYTLRSRKLRGEEKTFVFLSDLHDWQFGEENRGLLQKIKALKPDAVLIGGDMMTVKKQAAIGSTLLLAERLAERWPVFYAEGNHETRLDRDRGCYGALYDELMEGLKKAGVVFLKNQSVDFGEDIRISGLRIDSQFYRRRADMSMEKEYLTQRLGAAAQDRFQILLAHSPLFHPAYADWGADLTLAGHFHGGTIQLPGGVGLMTPQFHFFYKKVTGIHVHGSKHAEMIVSQGLGTHSVNLRINNYPQLVCVHLKGADVQ
ncbi:MAG: metallophosphoesterase [Stomatobaculum sp.]